MAQSTKSFNWLLVLILILMVNGLRKNFDVSSMTFQKPYLCALYGVVLVAGLYLLVRDVLGKKKDVE